jgi:hypothetical protein
MFGDKTALFHSRAGFSHPVNGEESLKQYLNLWQKIKVLPKSMA